MEKIMISDSTLMDLDDAMSGYGAMGFINALITDNRERASMIAAIQYGAGNVKRDENEDPREVLEELRECYTADTAIEADERAYMLQCFCKLIEAADDVVRQYRSQWYDNSSPSVQAKESTLRELREYTAALQENTAKMDKYIEEREKANELKRMQLDQSREVIDEARTKREKSGAADAEARGVRHIDKEMNF